ncbi:Pyridoxal phosphate-dependent decarboxylase [Dillenia turbinata]|uniref:Pyridoxal phosphate-dependent decarboxylase n=1 Tax=Dillenia turbinata TaxID=194707 RepID=A0AAN8VZK1_9MAGN
MMRTREGGMDLKPMDAEQLRESAHKMVGFIADYYQTIESFSVLGQVRPEYLHQLLPDSAPNHSEPLQDVLNGDVSQLSFHFIGTRIHVLNGQFLDEIADVDTKILPGVTHWQSPNYIAYFPFYGSFAGSLGQMLSAGINIVGFSWVTSPAATELETIVTDSLAKLLKLPRQGGGVMQGTASEFVLTVQLAARDKVLKKVGKSALGKLVVYSSDQTHACIQKASQIAGIHAENCRAPKTDSSTNFDLSPRAVSDAISQDTASGRIPLFLCATVGTTSSTGVDPFASLGKIAKLIFLLVLISTKLFSYISATPEGNGMWFHVDAAYAESAYICPEYRHYIDGVEEADSFDLDPHKWFPTNFDCAVLWVKEPIYLPH